MLLLLAHITAQTPERVCTHAHACKHTHICTHTQPPATQDSMPSSLLQQQLSRLQGSNRRGAATVEDSEGLCGTSYAADGYCPHDPINQRSAPLPPVAAAAAAAGVEKESDGNPSTSTSWQQHVASPFQTAVKSLDESGQMLSCCKVGADACASVTPGNTRIIYCR